jgi:hypothetical protein
LSKNLVSIERKHIDQNSIQGLILDESDELLLVQYVYDFQCDGLLVLSKSDITEVVSTKTDKFQTKLMKNLELLDNQLLASNYDIQSWREFFRSIRSHHKYVIVEQERFEDPVFTIGRIERNLKSHIKMRHFTGIARWDDELQDINYDDITSCGVASNYINVYERYFEKLESKNRNEK